MLGFILKRFLIDRPPKAALTSPQKKKTQISLFQIILQFMSHFEQDSGPTPPCL